MTTYVYRITEDGERFCVAASTMQDAVAIAERRFLDDPSNVDGEDDPRGYYHSNVLQSCELVGELVNSEVAS